MIMLSIWNPILTKRNQNKSYLDTMFEDLFGGYRLDKFSNLSFGIEENKTEDGVLIYSIDVPGVKESDITVEISESNMLTVKGERKTPNSSYSIYKSVSIPSQYDTSTVIGELKDGVLTVKLQPKPDAPRQSKKIEIRTVDSETKKLQE